MKQQKEDAVGGSGSVRRTARADMELLSSDIYHRVVDGCRFCLGVITLEKAMFGKSVKYRLNGEFAAPAAVEYVRRKFRAANLVALFQGGPGLELNPAYGLYRVKNTDFGLPMNCLVGLIQGPKPAAQAVVVFGGERLEGKLESRLETLDGVLGGENVRKTARGDALPELADAAEMLNKLKAINPKRLFDHDLAVLAELLNNLEEHKEAIPKALRPRYSSLEEYIMKKRLGRRN